MKRYIISNPKVMEGKPFIAGTDITVQFVLDMLASGNTIDQLTNKYPKLTKDSILEALSFTSELLNRIENFPIAKSIKLYSNNKLAQLYRQAVCYDSIDPFSHRQTFDKNKEVIKNACINIHEFYIKHKSLSELNIKGLSPKMKKIIEMILSTGIKETQQELAESQIIKSYRKSGPMEERNILPDKPPSQSWDNIIRKIEE